MKKRNFFTIIVILSMAVSAGASDLGYSASAKAVDGLAFYYASMAKLDVQGSLDRQDYTGLLNFVENNREKVISRVFETGSFYSLGRAEQITQNLYKSKGVYHPYTRVKQSASAECYFDSRTGHRYYKVTPDTYAEFSKKGEFLKNIPSDLPLLTTSRNIIPISDDSFILYSRVRAGKKTYKALPCSARHPEGWKADKAMVAFK